MPLPPLISTWIDRAASASIGAFLALLVQSYFRRADRPRLRLNLQGAMWGPMRTDVPGGEYIGLWSTAVVRLKAVHSGARPTTILVGDSYARRAGWRWHKHRPSIELLNGRERSRSDVHIGEGRSADLEVLVDVPEEWMMARDVVTMKLTLKHTYGRAKCHAHIPPVPVPYKS